MLTPEERRLIFLYCMDHPVARCGPCHEEYRRTELAADLLRGLSHLCPKCFMDLTESVREHIATCIHLADGVRRSPNR
jgi:hypothetical protein